MKDTSKKVRFLKDHEGHKRGAFLQVNEAIAAAWMEDGIVEEVAKMKIRFKQDFGEHKAGDEKIVDHTTGCRLQCEGVVDIVHRGETEAKPSVMKETVESQVVQAQIDAKKAAEATEAAAPKPKPQRKPRAPKAEEVPPAPAEPK